MRFGGVHTPLILAVYSLHKRNYSVYCFFKGRYDHTNPIFKENRLLKLSDIISLYTNCFVHRAIHLHPFDLGYTVIQHGATRRALHLRLPLCRTSHIQHCILLRGAKFWNDLPEILVTVTNGRTFKHRLSNMLLTNYCDEQDT